MAHTNVGLTGSAPLADSSGSVAGLTHEWSIKTEYYEANIPIWLDELADLGQWQAEFSNPEAKEVIEAIGGWIYCFDKKEAVHGQNASAQNVVEDTMKSIEEVVNKACGYSWEGIKLAVAMPSHAARSTQEPINVEDWEDRCMQYGFELVDAEATGKNEFGEAVGIARVKEALEANDWSTQLVDGAEDSEDFGDLGDEKAQMNAELWGLKASLLGSGIDPEERDNVTEEDEALQVEEMQRMMSQALAIKGMVQHRGSEVVGFI